MKKSFHFHHDKNVRHTQEKVMRKHYHNLFEIYFITEGTCTYFIDNKIYHLEKGDLILIPEGIIHNTKYGSSSHSRMLINCPSAYIPLSVQSRLSSLLYLYRNPAIYPRILHLFEEMEQEYQNPDRLTEDVLLCAVQRLFLLLARHQNTAPDALPEHGWIGTALDYLQKNYTREISLSQVAAFCAVSPEHFSRMFKKETGFGFNKYLNLLRLKQAESLFMQSTSASVTSIANQCGFADSNYFSVKFKELYGVSPKKFLQMHIKNT